ncbi:MAG TPA: prepilin-type N-terminal cleavage/methylation domain-containing protein [Myxococcota bacterium]|nr:prepilin-type N-terminal cleavage/methylation domain-containing protein [Myxococcota bacterium]
MRPARARNGFTMIEVMVVSGIVAAVAAIAVPAWRAVQANNRLRDAAGDVADTLAVARARAISSGNNFVVYFNTGLGGGTDVCGNALEDRNGNPVPILILDDGPPGGANANCCIDAGEPVETRPGALGVQWGVDFAANPAPGDPDPTASFASGTTFVDPAGAQTERVAFRPDGIPAGFDDGGGAGGCTLGTTGTGSGAIYVNNDRRDMAIVLSPLGSVRVHSFERSGGAWNN